MRMIIVGCGRNGSGLAQTLSKMGHAVTVIDSDASAFKALGPSFKGKTVEGIGFDRDILLKAKVEGQFVIGELQGFEGMDINALADLLEQEAAKAVAEEMRDCFEYSQLLGADILSIGNHIQQRSPGKWKALAENYGRITLLPDVTLEFKSPGALREVLDLGGAQ